MVKNPPMGLAGEALIPKYPSSIPLLNGVPLNKAAVAEPVISVPVIVGVMPVLLLGSSMSMRILTPVAGPGLTVKPKPVMGFWDVGLLLPLSLHPTEQYPERRRKPGRKYRNSAGRQNQSSFH